MATQQGTALSQRAHVAAAPPAPLVPPLPVPLVPPDPFAPALPPLPAPLPAPPAPAGELDPQPCSAAGAKPITAKPITKKLAARTDLTTVRTVVPDMSSAASCCLRGVTIARTRRPTRSGTLSVHGAV